MKSNKIICLMLAVLFIFSFLTACQGTESVPPSPALAEPTPDPTAYILTDAEAAIDAIRKNSAELKCAGTAYYVSNSGLDSNDGLSPETPWATLERVNSAGLSPGDGLYFERGGLWRGQLWAREGVTYSAYGSGDKPRIYASPENGAEPSKWSLLEGCSNIWVYHSDIPDCGVIVFNEGESFAKKVVPAYMDGFISTKDAHQSFDVMEELDEDLMFFSGADSILYEGAPFRYTVMDWCDTDRYPENVVGTLYLRCDAGNPGEVFDSIEFAVRENIVIPADDAVFHNLCLKYSGSHGIFGGDMGYDVSFCEIGWIGGSIQYYTYDSGAPMRFGNGVECDGSYDHFSVTDCYIYQCFDAGVSNQDPSEDPNVTGRPAQYRDVIQQNITYARNVYAYNLMSVEIFFTPEDDAGYGRHRMENVLIEDCYFLYTGYGYGYYRSSDKIHCAGYMGHWTPNASENFRILNNVFYLSAGPLLHTAAPNKWLPVVDGNTYVQDQGGRFVHWTDQNGQAIYYNFLITESYDSVSRVASEILGDKNAVVLAKK